MVTINFENGSRIYNSPSAPIFIRKLAWKRKKYPKALETLNFKLGYLKSIRRSREWMQDVKCNFCGIPASKTSTMVASPREAFAVYICTACVNISKEINLERECQTKE